MCTVPVLLWLTSSTSASAPTANGVAYKVNKNCQIVLKQLWRLMRVVWKAQIIPSEWSWAVTTCIPKEQHSCTINHFRGITLLNVEGKIIFTVVAWRMTNDLLSNNYITLVPWLCGTLNYDLGADLDSQAWKDRPSGSLARPGKCLWLCPPSANLFCPWISPHSNLHPEHCIQLLWQLQGLLHKKWGFDWHHLEKQIAMDCSISPILPHSSLWNHTDWRETEIWTQSARPEKLHGWHNYSPSNRRLHHTASKKVKGAPHMSQDETNQPSPAASS